MHRKKLDEALKIYKRDATKAAKDLLYGDEVIEKIKNAETEGEMERIMIGARRNKK